MKCLAGSAFLVAFSLGGAALAADQWREVHPDKSGFTVMMPGEPSLEQQQIKGSSSPNNIYGVKEGNESFVVSYTDYPTGIVKQAGPAQVMNGVENGAVNAVKGKLRSQRDVALGDAQGREAIIDTGDYTLKARYYLAGDRLYQVVYFGQKGSEDGADANKFLDSFRVTPD